MKVLFVLPTLSYRGTERYIAALAKGLTETGHQSVILVGRVEKYTPEIDSRIRLLSPPAFVNHLTQNNFVFLILTFPLLFFRILRNLNHIDIIYSESGFALWASILAGRIKSVKVIWLVPSVELEPFNSKILNQIFNLTYFKLDRFFARMVAAVATVSWDNARKIKKLYRINNASINLIAIDTSRFANANPSWVRKKYKLFGKQILLVPAVLHPKKNQELAINCLPKIIEEFPNVRLVFVGEGKDYQRLSNLVLSKKLEDFVIFAGFGNDRVLADFYAAAELVLVTAGLAREGLNATAFEALACGKMAVVAKNGGASKIFESEKIGIVAKKTIKDYSAAILNYLRNEGEFQKIRKRGQSLVLKEMSVEKLTKDSLKLFENCLKQ